MTSAVRVWSPLVRIMHWSIAMLVAIDLVNEASANAWHRYFGYAVGALVIVRLACGLVSPGSARLSTLIKTASEVARYVRHGAPPNAYIAHNPLGAWMALALWALILFVVTTGVLLQVEQFWGDETLQMLHRNASYVLAACAVVHIGGVLATSVRTHTNLVKAMITGNKALPGVHHDRS